MTIFHMTRKERRDFLIIMTIIFLCRLLWNDDEDLTLIEGGKAQDWRGRKAG